MKRINLNKKQLTEVIETAQRDKYELLDFTRIILSRLAVADFCENTEKLELIELIGHMISDIESLDLKTIKWEE